MIKTGNELKGNKQENWKIIVVGSTLASNLALITTCIFHNNGKSYGHNWLNLFVTSAPAVPKKKIS